MSVRRAMGGVAVLVIAMGCGEPGELYDDETRILGWDEFRGRAFQEPDTGVYILNGDEVAADEAELREAYARYRSEQGPEEGTSQQPLVVNRVGGKDDRWSTAQAKGLTYCVSKTSFGERYASVVRALHAAVAAWEHTARVNFVHRSAEDASCNRNSPVVFDVRRVCNRQYFARSFFPSSTRSARELLVDCSAFEDIAPWTLTGVLLHELGHTLGFRHEHTRPEAGVCFEDDRWRPLTSYDSDSVMHYPQCDGTRRGDLVLTQRDRAGARSLYP